VTAINDLALSVPALAGERYSLSVNVSAEGELQTLELWGTDEKCGAARELLWWAPLSSGILCAEFVPRQTYTHLIYVLRRQSLSGNTTVKSLEMAFCPEGTCRGGGEGHTRPDAGELYAPIGPYARKGGGTSPGLWNWDIGNDGHMLFVTGGPPNGGGPVPISSGIFRTGRADPFGDAWYCIGEGSTFAFLDRPQTFSFRNITRLAACKDKPGSGVSKLTLIGSYVEVESSFAELVRPSLFAKPGACDSHECWFPFSDQNVTAPLQIFTREDLGVPAGGITVNGTIEEASWIQTSDAGGGPSLWCGTSGTLEYVLLGTTRVEIGSMSGPLACPGEPIDRTTFDGKFE
jgi:hypothetical protein